MCMCVCVEIICKSLQLGIRPGSKKKFDRVGLDVYYKIGEMNKMCLCEEIR